MNILYLAHRIPYPPNKGDKTRSFHEIQYLARRHTIHLCCLIDDRDDIRHVRSLATYCASVNAAYRGATSVRLLGAFALWNDKPLSVASFYSRKLRRRIRQLLSSSQIDLIFTFSSAMAAYVDDVRDIPRIMDFVDVDSAKWSLYGDYKAFPLSRVYRLEATRLARFEEHIARSFDHSILVSQREADLLRRRVANRPISVIPNGVDLDYFQPGGVGGIPDTSRAVIVFAGAMDYFPNMDAVGYFCGQIFPLIRAAVPEARFYVVGRNPARPVRRLRRHPNVVVTGTVGDIRPYLAAAAVSVAPLRIARGVQNKILEAMAMGVPVVATSVAAQGIDAEARTDLVIADDSREFAQRVIDLLAEESRRKLLSARVRERMEGTYAWESRLCGLEKILLSVKEGSDRSGSREGMPAIEL